MAGTTMATEVRAAGATGPGTGPDPDARPDATRLPRWPLAALFVWFPLWWVLGVVDLVWIPVAAVMAGYLALCRGVRVPRGFGLWLVFLGWAGASVIMLDGVLDLAAFTYRLMLYVAGGVLLVYVYNARRTLTPRYLCGCLTVWWVATVLGGYAGLLWPEASVRTPMSRLVPPSMAGNELVDHMVVRRLAQYDPGSFLEVAPRPAAPFLYTNNWGNAYSLLLPFVVVYLLEVRRGPRCWTLVLLAGASAVPAMLTLNRGMFLGIGIALAYVGVRAALAGRWRTVAGLAAVAVAGVAAYHVLPVGERLEQRLSGDAASTSNDTRASVYLQALELVPGSPLFGYGAPQTGVDPDAVPVGTQGQVWMVLVSHGPIATACYVAFFVAAFLGVVRRRDRVGLLSSTVLLVGTVELFYYGALPYGLPLLMVAAALGLRGDHSPGPDRPLEVSR